MSAPVEDSSTVHHAAACERLALPAALAENVTAAARIDSAYPAPMRVITAPTMLSGTRIISSAPTVAQLIPNTTNATRPGGLMPNVLSTIGAGSTARIARAAKPPSTAAAHPVSATAWMTRRRPPRHSAAPRSHSPCDAGRIEPSTVAASSLATA